MLLRMNALSVCVEGAIELEALRGEDRESLGKEGFSAVYIMLLWRATYRTHDSDCHSSRSEKVQLRRPHSPCFPAQCLLRVTSANNGPGLAIYQH